MSLVVVDELAKMLAKGIEERGHAGLIIGVALEETPLDQTLAFLNVLKGLRGFREVCCCALTGKTHLITSHGTCNISSPRFAVDARGSTSDEATENQVRQNRAQLMRDLFGRVSCPDITGSVMLCGDFATAPPQALIALCAIMKGNGAGNIVIAAPVLLDKTARVVKGAGFALVSLHPVAVA